MDVGGVIESQDFFCGVCLRRRQWRQNQGRTLTRQGERERLRRVASGRVPPFWMFVGFSDFLPYYSQLKVNVRTTPGP